MSELEPDTDTYDDSNANLFHDAFYYALPLIVMDETKRAHCKTTPINQFSHAQQFRTPGDRIVVLPNADTLYSMAWIEGITEDPVILTIPEVKLPDGRDRYFLFPIIDAYTDVIASPGLRTKDKYPYPASYALVRKDFAGELPYGVGRIEIDSDIAWIFGRICTFGPEDYENVYKIQDGFKLTPLSKWNTGYTSPKYIHQSSATSDIPPATVAFNMGSQAFFDRFLEMWQKNPPRDFDASIMEFCLAVYRLRRGITKWDLDQASIDNTQPALEAAKLRLPELIKVIVSSPNWWNMVPSYVGYFGNNYVMRAFIAWVGVGINLPVDSMFPRSDRDLRGREYNCKYRYRMHLDAEPPVNGFWSLSMYDKDLFFVKNDANIQVVGSNHSKFSAGPIDIWIQATRPAELDLGGNNLWLPCPQPPADGSNLPFKLCFRLYWPKEEILKERWFVPGVERIGLL